MTLNNPRPEVAPIMFEFTAEALDAAAPELLLLVAVLCRGAARLKVPVSVVFRHSVSRVGRALTPGSGAQTT